MMKPSLVELSMVMRCRNATPAVLRHRMQDARRLESRHQSAGRPGWSALRGSLPSTVGIGRDANEATVSDVDDDPGELAHTGHEPRRATQKARSAVVERWAWALFLREAVTCCRMKRRSPTPGRRRRRSHAARMASDAKVRRGQDNNVEHAADCFAVLRPRGIQAPRRKSLIPSCGKTRQF